MRISKKNKNIQKSYDLPKTIWWTLKPHLPQEDGRWARPSFSNRKYINGMLWVLATGSAWRDMPRRYGKWNSVHRRYRRWQEQGVWDLLIKELGKYPEYQEIQAIALVMKKTRARTAALKRIRNEYALSRCAQKPSSTSSKPRKKAQKRSGPSKKQSPQKRKR